MQRLDEIIRRVWMWFVAERPEKRSGFFPIPFQLLLCQLFRVLVLLGGVCATGKEKLHPYCVHQVHPSLNVLPDNLRGFGICLAVLIQPFPIFAAGL